MAALVTTLSSGVTFVTNTISSVMTTVNADGNEIILLAIALPFVGRAIGYFKSLLSANV